MNTQTHAHVKSTKPGYEKQDATEKLANVLSFVARKLADPAPIEVLVGIVYMAEKMHLSAFGRMICRSRYLADKAGLVPVLLPDAIAMVRPDGTRYFSVTPAGIAVVSGPDIEKMSHSETQCLREACAVAETWGKDAMIESSRAVRQDDAWRLNAGEVIGAMEIAKSMPDSEDLVAHLQEFARGE